MLIKDILTIWCCPSPLPQSLYSCSSISRLTPRQQDLKKITPELRICILLIRSCWNLGVLFFNFPFVETALSDLNCSHLYYNSIILLDHNSLKICHLQQSAKFDNWLRKLKCVFAEKFSWENLWHRSRRLVAVGEPNFNNSIFNTLFNAVTAHGELKKLIYDLIKMLLNQPK